jgi:phosphinothricin acetyltransferase
MSFIIKPMKEGDWEAVRRIYQAGIDTGIATFETAAPDWERWNAGHLKGGRFAAWLESIFVGWAALSPISSRNVYSGVVELSIYIDPAHRGERIGSRLMEALIAYSEASLIWTLQSSIIAENQASLELHRKYGFREVGYRERIAQLNGVWHDTILMERRSRITGV